MGFLCIVIDVWDKDRERGYSGFEGPQVRWELIVGPVFFEWPYLRPLPDLKDFFLLNQATVIHLSAT
jgi:hypothetical protein